MEPLEVEVAVIGGGPVGCVLAALLARRGHRVDVFERRPDLRAVELAAGRSINLVLTRRGLRALERLGLADAVLGLTVPVLGRMMHDPQGGLAYQPYGKDDSERNHSISRGELNRCLLDHAAAAGVRLHFERALVDADLARGALTLARPDGPPLAVRARHVFGCDGAPSAVREALARRHGAHATVEPLSHGYKELTFPARPDGGYAMEARALHIWPRGAHMLMGLPNRDGSFTGTVYLPWQGPDGFEALTDPAAVLAFFGRHYPDAVPLLGDLARDFLANPTGHLETVRCRPWRLEDRALLLGDAAHAIVPFFGQGLNCGFEDTAVLDDLLATGGSLTEVFAELEALRKPAADAIADLALENFVEMRDRVGDPAFLLRKQVEHLLETRFPDRYRSRYAMVMYSSIPYHQARELGEVQEALLTDLTRGIAGPEQVDLARAERLIEERLTPIVVARGIDLGF